MCVWSVEVFWKKYYGKKCSIWMWLSGNNAENQNKFISHNLFKLGHFQMLVPVFRRIPGFYCLHISLNGTKLLSSVIWIPLSFHRTYKTLLITLLKEMPRTQTDPFEGVGSVWVLAFTGSYHPARKIEQTFVTFIWMSSIWTFNAIWYRFRW